MSSDEMVDKRLDPFERAPLILAAPERVVPGQYIIVLNDSLEDADIASQILAKLYGGTLLRTWNTAIKGFAAALDQQALEAMRLDARVQFIEQNQVVIPTATQSNAPT